MLINKVVFAKGAVFDYEGIVCKIPMQTGAFKAMLEKLIDEEKCRVLDCGLRAVCYDEASGMDLMFFIKKGYCFGPMQVFMVQGVCSADDYCEEMEENGIIKEWLEVEIE